MLSAVGVGAVVAPMPSVLGSVSTGSAGSLLRSWQSLSSGTETSAELRGPY